MKRIFVKDGVSMKINKRLISVALASTFLVSFLILISSTASAMYALQTINGNYLTAVNGGGLTTDAIRSNATTITGNEKFNLIPQSGNWYALQTSNGNYLTAVGGGGQAANAIRSDATAITKFEMFSLIPQGGDRHALKTPNGNYLTAVGGGGQTTDAIHSDATFVTGNEMFKLIQV